MLNRISEEWNYCYLFRMNKMIWNNIVKDKRIKLLIGYMHIVYTILFLLKIKILKTFKK